MVSYPLIETSQCLKRTSSSFHPSERRAKWRTIMSTDATADIASKLPLWKFLALVVTIAGPCLSGGYALNYYHLSDWIEQAEHAKKLLLEETTKVVGLEKKLDNLPSDLSELNSLRSMNTQLITEKAALERRVSMMQNDAHNLQSENARLNVANKKMETRIKELEQSPQPMRQGPVP
jgi:hypothetical protein